MHSAFFTKTAEYKPQFNLNSDFLIEGMTFEVDGKNKKRKQIESVENGYVVKDDIERGFLNTIPLRAFGLNY